MVLYDDGNFTWILKEIIPHVLFETFEITAPSPSGPFY